MHAKNKEFEIPAILYRPEGGNHGKKRPTLIVGNGYDGSQEEMLHVNVYAALERGWNVITYEGPGQPTVRREPQSLGFITEWEKVVSPVIDYLEKVPEVDMRQLAIFGYSFGGFLAPRAAAFEKRIKAVVAIDGVFSAGEAFLSQLPLQFVEMYEKGDREGLDNAVDAILSGPDVPSEFRWGVEQGLWSFKIRSPFDFLRKAQEMTMANLTQKIQVPVFVGNAESEVFFRGQPRKLADALGTMATYHEFKDEEAAGSHCQVGAAVRMNEVVFGWLNEVFNRNGN